MALSKENAKSRKFPRFRKKNDKLPNAIQKRLLSMYAGDTGLSGRQIVDFLSEYSNSIPPYRFDGSPPRRSDVFEDCLARMPLREQRRAISESLDYEGFFSYGRAIPA